jgi:putative FmdB family regulatory protein
MPTYDYECRTCGHRFEAFQSIHDQPLKSCPQCGKRVRRLIGGGVGIIFKGSGFYVTDSKKSGNGGGSAKKSAPGEAAASTAGSSGEAKSETRAESKPDEKKKSSESKSADKVAV